MRVCGDFYGRPFSYLNLDAGSKFCYPGNPLRNIHPSQFWLRQPREARVRGHEAGQRFRARTNDSKSLAKVLQDRVARPILQFRRLDCGLQPALEALRHGLNWCERVIEFVAENSDQALPCLALRVSQRAAEVAQNDQTMGQTTLAEKSTAHAPAPRAAREIQFHGATGFALKTGLQA